MNKNLTLSIANPCHENWDKMSDDAKGKFCGACQKQVIDFTAMSDRELVAFFKKPAGSVCGRFRADQLDKQMAIPKKRIPWIRYFFTISLPAFLFSMKSAAQQFREADTTVFIPQTPKKLMLGKVSKIREEITFSGRVVDEQGNPVPFASVIVKGEKIGVAADENGFYKIKADLKFPLTVEVSSVGFQSTEMKIKSAKPANITLKQSMLMGDIVISTSSPVMLGGISASVCVFQTAPDSSFETTSAFDVETVKSSEDIIRNGKFQVFPNPVRRGNGFTVVPGKMENGVYKINISDIAGNIVQSREVTVREGSAFSFNLGDVAAGVYLVSLLHNKSGTIATQKIVLK